MKSILNNRGYLIRVKCHFVFLILFFAVMNGHAQSAQKENLSEKEAADRIAIKNLIDGYSHDADRREAEKQAGLFTPDGEIEVFQGEPGVNKATALIKGSKDLTAGFQTLRKYDITMHFNGQSTIQLKGDTATGETYCLAHHIWKENGQRMLMVMGIRYYDTFVRIGGQWYFAKRQLIFDWIDKRPSKSEN
jgi:hypothetical protein